MWSSWCFKAHLVICLLNQKFITSSLMERHRKATTMTLSYQILWNAIKCWRRTQSSWGWLYFKYLDLNNIIPNMISGSIFLELLWFPLIPEYSFSFLSSFLFSVVVAGKSWWHFASVKDTNICEWKSLNDFVHLTNKNFLFILQYFFVRICFSTPCKCINYLSKESPHTIKLLFHFRETVISNIAWKMHTTWTSKV